MSKKALKILDNRLQLSHHQQCFRITTYPFQLYGGSPWSWDMMISLNFNLSFVSLLPTLTRISNFPDLGSTSWSSTLRRPSVRTGRRPTGAGPSGARPFPEWGASRPSRCRRSNSRGQVSRRFLPQFAIRCIRTKKRTSWWRDAFQKVQVLVKRVQIKNF